ncbi:hypothetical protein SODALDRAFT_319140 [Sodiomyces alkalinus F11]|uniref:Cupredoxin n=1 Tax=Sodiomyces alkalinus (strain CBS 110278 / VKM F-3762 / F11) TaxID=1314773 RepID=A0A3N2Q736_SODAK|nr:hypothetical protein SODALDRAFT_319140 [Sodiomyces alkalinus F11]ROT42468.1 hypothetical protein SODALDRAFT_319140 [Sodiomyces alkalinus F11]
MKWSAAITLSAAALSSAKAVRNTYPKARDLHEVPEHVQPNPHLADLPHGMRGHGITPDSNNHVVVIWVNPGGHAETTTINQKITVTETIVVGAHTPPPEAHAPEHPPIEHPPVEHPPVEHPPVEHPPVHPPPVEHPGAGTPTHPGEATQVAPSPGATHSVTVGGPAGLIYHPESINAQVGDMVIFTFFAANHTATQSTFDSPCEPLAGGMDSGFIPNPENSIDPPPQVAMQVMVENPLWFFCAQGPHCAKGMVFSINPTAERTHAMFQSIAISGGNGDAAPITGGEPAPAPEQPPTESAPPPPIDSLPPVQSGLPPIEGGNNVLPPGGGIQDGIGQIDGNGACVCSVQCDMGAFPNLEQQGIGAVGGIGGSMPMGQPVRKRW